MICIIDCGSEEISNFSKILDELKTSNKIIKLNELNESLINDFSGIIISGAPILLTKIDKQKYLDKFKFIKEINVPILGICFGHQIIGLLFGSEIYLGEEVRSEEQIEIVNKDIIFSGLENRSLFQEDHCEFIALPKEFVLLAKSHTCNNEAMKHTTKKIYGLQFHPEASGLNGKIILKNFAKICGK
ncbi:MAG: gamma-glutamyl-gamma-aminobutyrate hydrolase family protein [Nanoarchaeota archaeon]|nr:gamma-glutamyl-gamma-aminobutyrate hydrolase family protein [Nanoarchaeota archaeon]